MNKDKIKLAREFCKEVAELAEKYGLSFFMVTEGASIARNKGVEAVRHARECHEKWEKEHGEDPNEDWIKDKISVEDIENLFGNDI